MSKHLDTAFVALLATLEDRARAKGDKSLIKALVARLTLSGANPALIDEVAALRPAKDQPVKAAKIKAPKIKAPKTEKPALKAKAKPAAKPAKKAAKTDKADTKPSAAVSPA